MTTIECPNHEGRFDCTPFCRLCEGDQEYAPEEATVSALQLMLIVSAMKQQRTRK